jgi:hypothetical protein
MLVYQRVNMVKISQTKQTKRHRTIKNICKRKTRALPRFGAQTCVKALKNILPT